VTSGLASIIKVTMAMEQGFLPASINFKSANKKIPFDDWGLKVINKLETWPTGPQGIKRASVNNFGYGGTNAHVIMESADSWQREHAPWPPIVVNKNDNKKLTNKVLFLSARSEKACHSMITNLKTYLESRKTIENAEALLENFVYTLGQHRSVFLWIAAHRISLTHGLDQTISDLGSPHFKPVRTSRQPRIGMVFTGQGAQWHAMGRELIGSYPTFRLSLEEADQYLRQFGAEWSLMEEFHRDSMSTKVNDVSVSIPICVALQIGLVQVLREWGLQPAAVTSHSSGEIAAAYTVGALNHKSAMAVAYYRAMLTARENQQRIVKGRMLALGVGIKEAEMYLERLTGNDKAVVACINSPSNVTVSGDAAAVQELEYMAKVDALFARRLKVDAAYHSHHMEPIARPYREALKNAQLEGPQQGDLNSIAYSSPVTGARVFSAEEIADPEHWVSSLIQPVRFVGALTDMILGDYDPSGSSVDVILEIGPHTALGGPIKDILALHEFEGARLLYFGSLTRNFDARDSIQDLAAKLLREGQPLKLAAVNFPGFRSSEVRVLTDLPSYPWDHHTRHWQESRINRSIRERKQPYHELLGSLAPWANPEAPSWRHVLRVDDAPWVRDYIMQSRIVYPEAGFLCLAIEAMVQKLLLQQTKVPVSGFRLRDVDIEQALVIPDNSHGVEVQTSLSTVSGKAIALQGWMNFSIATVTADGNWTLHAKGAVIAEFDDTDNAPQPARFQADNDVLGHTWRRFDTHDFYANLRSFGIKRGPKFQNVTSILQSTQEQSSAATFIITDNTTSKSLSFSHVLHPTTLDTIIQAAYTALPGAGTHMDNPKVPKSIGRVWVSNEIVREPGSVLKAWSSLRHDDIQSMRADVSVVSDHSGKALVPVLLIEDLVLQSLGESALPERINIPWAKEVCNKLVWAPDMSVATPGLLGSLKQQIANAVDPEENGIIADLRRACIYFIDNALASLSLTDVQKLDGHYKKYHIWLRKQLELAASGQLNSGSADWTNDDAVERQRRLEGVAVKSVNGEMVCQLGPHLAAILRGKQPPLEIMMQDRLLYKYYSNMLKCPKSFQHAASILHRLVHKHPRARIIEIGAGTGGGTRYALPVLGTAATGGPLVEHYDYTDVTPAFFEAAAEEFADWAGILQFRKLDIETDPCSQGFEAASYDIVIACQCLHATKSMANTMANVRKLMKPNGTLLLVETTKDQVDVQFVFGLLPGWWLSQEKERESSPSLSILSWDQTLKDAGFTGVDLEIHDCESEELYSISTIMSTAFPVRLSKLPSAHDLVLVTSSRAPPSQGWIEMFQSIVVTEGLGGTLPTVQDLETGTPAAYSGKICVIVGEAAERPLLCSLDAASLEGIKAMATACKGLLWVTRGGAIDCERPNSGLAAGFMRSLRNEYVGRQFLTLDLDPNTSPWSDSDLSAIMRVLKVGFESWTEAFVDDISPNEFEYAERGGCLLIPRIYKDIVKNKAVFPEPIDYSEVTNWQVHPLHQAERPLRLQIGQKGRLETIVFDDDDRAHIHNDVLGDEMIEIEPKAYGVNLRNVMTAMGQTEDSVLALECAGVIKRVGVQAKSQGYVDGDRVFCLLNEPFASRVCVKWTSIMHMPVFLTFEEAASIPVALSTAYYSLCEVARLRQGQSVLIHAAAGGVGQAAIMVAQHVGATIFATVGSLEERTLIMDKYGIPAERIFSSRCKSFAQGVLLATDGHGVDVVLNSLTGPLLQASFDVLAPFGHLVEIGKHDLERNSSLEMHPFARHVSFSSVDLTAMLRHRGQDVHRVLATVARLVADKTVVPVHPIIVYPIGQATEAFQLLHAGKHVGKVVLSTGPHEVVPVLPRRVKARLSANASYLLVGGLRDIGQSVARWMIDRGAKNMILLSRVVSKKWYLVNQIQQAGCRVKVISCDVSNAASLKQALNLCAKEQFPPVRGVVQTTMILNVSTQSIRLRQEHAFDLTLITCRTPSLSE
jgi:acyl transferase domain-containing protein/NADPH:quinone reductase-like Zn-dependent oxidoreductase/SAM-dependent methyltransferase